MAVDVSNLDLSKYEKAFHPITRLFPLDRKVLQDVCISMETIGFRKGSEIVLDTQGLVIEGRKRYIAAELTEETPRYTHLKNGECEATVARLLNFARTHYTEGERAQIAGKLYLEEQKHKESSIAEMPSQSEHAEEMNVSPRSVGNVVAIETKGTEELKAAVASGDISVTRGGEIAQLPPDEQVKAVAEEQLKGVSEPDPIVRSSAAKRRRGTLNACLSLLDKQIATHDKLLTSCEKLGAKQYRKHATLKDAEKGLAILKKISPLYEAYRVHVKTLRRKKARALA